MNNEVDKKSIRKCTLCGREYLKPQAICPKCNIALMKLSDYERLGMEENRSNFQKEVERQEKLQREQNIPKCPTCGSTNVKPISTLNRAVSIGMFGLFSSKIGKNYECLNCKMKW